VKSIGDVKMCANYMSVKRCNNGYRRSKKTGKCEEKLTGGISFLFLTYDDIVHGNVMYDYVKTHKVHIHSKKKVTDYRFKSRVIPHSVPTEWGSISIVKATIELLRTAYYTTQDSWFILLSQDVFPTTPIGELELFLKRQSKSLFNVHGERTNTWNADKWFQNNIWKADQWFILSRKDVDIILSLTTKEFNTIERLIKTGIEKRVVMGAYDEFFFLTALKSKGIDYTQFQTMYTEWLPPQFIGQHPFTFNRLLDSDTTAISTAGSFFIRKTLPSFDPSPIRCSKTVVLVYVGTESKQNYSVLLKKDIDIIVLSAVPITNICPLLLKSCIKVIDIIYKFYNQISAHLLGEIRRGKVWDTVIQTSEAFNMHKINNDSHRGVINDGREYATVWNRNSNSSKIAFLFLTSGNVNNQSQWETYFKSHWDDVSIYVHAKYPEKVTIPWMVQNLIPTVDTEWGYIVDAYFNLFTKAMENKSNIKFVTISESCLPLRSFDEFNSMLRYHDERTSFIRFSPLSNYDRISRIQNQPNYKMQGNFIKHYARFCLSRYHIQKVLASRNQSFFKSMHVGDEFFLTLLQPVSGRDFIVNYEITYDDWKYVDKQKHEINVKIKHLYETSGKSSDIKALQTHRNDIGKNPRTFTTYSQVEADIAKATGAFFWRKFNQLPLPRCPKSFRRSKTTKLCEKTRKK